MAKAPKTTTPTATSTTVPQQQSGGIGGVPLPETTQTRHPIGVPPTGAPGYSGVNRGQTGSASVYDTFDPGFITPQYYAGDELVGRNWGAEQVIDWQNRLVQMGLLTRNQYQVGVWDDKTADAYSHLLGYANSSGKDANSAASELLSRVQQFGDTTIGTRTPFVARLTRPETLMSMAKELSTRVMDRQLTDSEAMRFATAFNDLERASQKSEYDLTGTPTQPGAGGDTYSPGSFDSYVQGQLENSQDPEIAASVSGSRLTHNASAFFDLLNSSRSRYDQAIHNG